MFLVGALLLAGGASTGETSYECDIGMRSSKNVPEQVFLTYDKSSGEAFVMDPFINHYVGKPMAAKVVIDNGKRLTVSWTLEGVTSKQGRTIVHDNTRLTVVKATLEASVSSGQGYGQVDTGQGRCKITQ